MTIWTPGSQYVPSGVSVSILTLRKLPSGRYPTSFMELRSFLMSPVPAFLQ